MNVRFLKVGEDEKWYTLMGEEVDEPFTESANYRPETHVISEENGKFIGGMEIFIDEPEMTILFNPIAKYSDPLKIIGQILNKGIEVGKSLKCRKIFTLLQNNPHLPAIRDLLTDLGFHFGLKKVLYRRKPISFSNYKSNLNLTYKSFTEIGEGNFIEAFRKVYEPDIFEADPEKTLIGLRRMAIRTKQFYPDDWVVAYLRNEAVGVSMPQLHDEEGELGSNFYLGVVHELRGNGIGKILQQRAIDTLINRRAKTIIGSCDIKNVPMIKIFESLSYEFEAYQYFYYLTFNYITNSKS